MYPIDKETREERLMDILEGRPQSGVFVRGYLREAGEAYPSEIHKAYKGAYKGVKSPRGKLYHIATYNSFMIYVHGLVLTGLVERTGKTEESDDPKGEPIDYPERVIIRLTEKGRRAPDHVWEAPLRVWYRPYDWEMPTFRDYIKEVE